MTQGRKIWVPFFSTLLTLGLVPLIIGLVMSRTILEPDYYQTFLEEQQFYERATPLLIDATVGALDSLTPDLVDKYFIGGLDKQQMRSIIISVLPEDWLKIQVDNFLDSVLTLISFSSTSIKYDLDLIPIKENMKGELGRVTLGKIKQVFPDCSLDFAKSLVKGWISGENNSSILCNPPEKIYTLAEPFLLRSLEKLGDTIPTKIPIWTYPSDNSNKLPNTPIFRVIRFIYLSYKFLPWICACLALAVILSSLPSKRAMLAALGIPLVVSCLLCDIAYILFYQAGELTLTASINPKVAPEFLKGFLDLIYTTGSSFLAQITNTAIVITLLFGGAGILMLLIAQKVRD